MSVRKAVGRGTTFVLMGVMLTGCALYSPTRDEQGKAQKAKWEAASKAIDDYRSTTRANRLAAFDEELKLEDQLWAVRREFLAQSILTSNGDKFSKRLAADEVWMFGPGNVGAVQSFDIARKAISSAESDYAVIFASSRSTGFTPPSCALLAPAAPWWNDTTKSEVPVPTTEPEKTRVETARKVVEEAINSQFASTSQGVVRRNALNDAKKAATPCLIVAAGYPNYGGKIGEAQQALANEDAGYLHEKAHLQVVEAQYRIAIKEADTAVAEYATAITGETGTKSSRDKLEGALKKAAAAAAKLENSENVYAKKVVAEARFTSIDRFLTTYQNIKEGKGTTAKEASSAAIGLAVFQELTDKAAVAIKDLHKPELLALAVQKGIEEARLAEAKRELAFVEQRITLRKDLLEALFKVASAHAEVERVMSADNVKKLLVPQGELILGAMAPLSAKEIQDLNSKSVKESDVKHTAEVQAIYDGKQMLWQALPLYLEAESTLRARAVKVERQLTAVSFAQADSYVDSSIAQWKALISPSIEVLAAYGASGVQATDIAKFLDTVALFIIGVRVN